jgi:hypothetical protein
LSYAESEGNASVSIRTLLDTRNRSAREACRPLGRPRGSFNLPWDIPIITSPALVDAVFFLNDFAYVKAASESFLPGLGTSVIVRTRSVCERFVAGWHASDSANVVSPKNNASDIASENVRAARGFVKQLKYPASPLRHLRSRRVVTQQNEFQKIFATALAAMTRHAHHVAQGVATVVIAAAR